MHESVGHLQASAVVTALWAVRYRRVTRGWLQILLILCWRSATEIDNENIMKLRTLLILAGANFLACSAFGQLTAADVTGIIEHAVTRAIRISPNSVIAV